MSNRVTSLLNELVNKNGNESSLVNKIFINLS